MPRTLLALAVALPWIAWAAVRVTGVAVPHRPTELLAFTPYAALTAAVPVVVALVLRRRAIALASIVAAVALVASVVPRATGDPARPGPRPVLTVMSVNVLRGHADPHAVMRLVEEHDVDVLALEESRPAFVAELDGFGAGGRLPYRNAARLDEALLSARPLRPTGWPAEGDLRIGSRTIRVRAVHPPPPVTTTEWREWKDELAALPSSGPGPVRHVLAGDFNATLDHPELRDVIDRGYVDAADQVGAGLHPTWPAGRRLPPEITIDHVLVDARLGVASFTVQPVPRTDHRAVIARIVVR